MAAKTAKVATPPQPTTIYARTGKGVLAYKNKTAKLPDLKDLFACIDGKASVADLGTETQMEAEELEQALDALEEKGYIKVFRQAAEQAVPDFTEAPDLDFTSPGSLLEISVREAAKAKADAEQQAAEEATQEQEQEEPAQAVPDTSAAPQSFEARIQELEAEADAMRRARNEAVKVVAQAKSLLAEERKRAEELTQKLAAAEAQQPAAQSGTTQEAFELQLATERETREQMVQALREAQSEAEAGRNDAVLRLKEAQIGLQAAEKLDRQNRDAERRTREGLQAEMAETKAELAETKAELVEAKAESERTSATVREHTERIKKLEAETDAERHARTEAETKTATERAGRENAANALLEIRKVVGAWKDE